MTEEVDRAVAAAAAQATLPPGVLVRAWRQKDFSAVQRLSAAERWPTPNERPVQAWLAWGRSWPALVAVAGEEIIGFIRCVGDGVVTTYVAELLIVPAWRGRGMGRALLEVAQRMNPGSRIDLLASAESRSFYEHLGLRPFHGFRRSWEELQ